jgi:P27 family predicted phage terminase small subunit
MAELLQLQQRLKKEYYVVEEATKSGIVLKTHPLVKVVTAKLSTVNAIGSQFGWSPVSRIRLAAMASGKDKDKDDFEDSINGK